MKFSANIELLNPLKPAGITDDRIYDIDITFEARNMATAGRILRTIIDATEVIKYNIVCIDD